MYGRQADTLLWRGAYAELRQAVTEIVPVGLRTKNTAAPAGHTVCDQTVGNILKDHGIEPVPDRRRRSTWKTLLKSHWDVLGAIDFTTVEVWTRGGLVTFYLLFVMELATRRVHFAGATPNPDDQWMKQVAKNLTDCEDGFPLGKRDVLLDCDTKFCEAFRDILMSEGIKCVVLPPRSPDLNAQIERFFKSLKAEALDRMILLGENMLRHAIGQFVEHYHAERNCQGLSNRLIEPGEVGNRVGQVESRKRLGGLLQYYYRDAA